MNATVCGFAVDAYWPKAKLVVELDGYGFHGHRQAFERDRERAPATA
jgi:very-short-patch-repair endonuclease